MISLKTIRQKKKEAENRKRGAQLRVGKRREIDFAVSVFLLFLFCFFFARNTRGAPIFIEKNN
jgi:hypothetical protein